MLIHFPSLLATPLLALAPSPAPHDRPLCDALPDTALAAVHVPAPQTLLSKRATNDYVGLMLDPRLIDAFTSAIAIDAEDENDANQAAEWAAALLGTSDELLLYVDVPSDSDPVAAPSGLVVARGGEDLRGLMLATLGESPTAHELSDGTEVLLGGDRESVGVSRIGDAHVLAFSDGPDDLSYALERLRETRSREEPSGPFLADGVARHRSADADIVGCVDLTSIWRPLLEDIEDPALRWVLEGCSTVRWVHATMAFGDAEAVDLDVAMPYAQDTFVDGVLDRFTEIDRGRLRDVPADAGRMDAFAIDLEGLLAWLETDMSEVDPAIGESIDQALTAAKEVTGIDLREDVIVNLEETLVTWESPGVDSTMPMLQPLATTYVFAFEDVDPLIDLMDVVQGLAAGLATVTTGSHLPSGSDEEYDLWTFDSDFGALQVAVGAGRMVVSSRDGLEQLLDMFATTGPEAPKRLVDDLRVEAALAALGSFRGGLTIQNAGAAGEMIRGVGAAFEAFDLAPSSGLYASEVRAKIEVLASIVEGYLDGIYVATTEVTADRLVIRGRSR